MSVFPGAGNLKKKTGKRKSMCQGTKELLKRVIKRNPRITEVQQL